MVFTKNLPSRSQLSILRRRLLALLPLLLLSLQQIEAQSVRLQSDKAIVTRKRLTIVRTGRVARDFPERRRATITYPLISGISNPVVLRKIKAILDFKNIFDYSLQEYRTDSWLDEFDYVVNHNGNYILDLTFTQSGMAAYPDSQSKHFSIDLRTGRVLKAEDVFLSTKLDELARLIDERLQNEIKELTKVVKADKSIDDPANVIEAYEQLKFEVANLSDFSVGRDGLTFLYDAGFPHVIEALQPDGQYKFTYAELKPFLKREGPLWQFVNGGIQ